MEQNNDLVNILVILFFILLLSAFWFEVRKYNKLYCIISYIDDNEDLQTIELGPIPSEEEALHQIRDYVHNNNIKEYSYELVYRKK